MNQQEDINANKFFDNELIVNIALLRDFNRIKFKDFSAGITDDDIDESLIFRGLQNNDSNKVNLEEASDGNLGTSSSNTVHGKSKLCFTNSIQFELNVD